jgi:ATP/maltotriose-dependent transcriptional regulator MalT/two-component SAPR family response regulator
MSQIIVKTRIIPKKITENIVSRRRLYKKFEENASKNIILVIGPAGYGKTTCVLDYLNSSGRRYAWLYLSPDIDNPSALLSYLVHSLKELKSSFGENTLELIGSLSTNEMFAKDVVTSINTVMGSFINEFVTEFTEDIYLVIDDLHNIEGAGWSNDVFNSLNDNFPDNLHIIITTRNVPGFSMAKLTAKRRLAKIQSDELNFTADETESLLKDIYSITCKKDDMNKLLGRIEGWITGLHLVLQAYGIDYAKATGENKQIDEDIFGYFAEDIFAQLEENTQDFLLSTSLLDNFTTDICKDVLGLTDSKKTLDELVRKNLFVESSQHTTESGVQETSYSYHNLFRQFLQKKLRDTKSEQEVKAIADRIFEYYSARGDYIQAIDFSLQAGSYDEAARLITDNFDELLRAARHESLRRWIEQFPAEMLSSNYDLLFIKSKLLNFFKGDTEEAAGIFNEIIKHSPTNTALYVNANSELAGIYRLTGKPDEALNIFKELYKLDAEPELKIKIIISLAKSYYRLGSKYYDEMLKLLNEAEDICSKNDIESLIPDIYSLYGRIHLNKGEFVKSLHYFESNLSKETNIYRRFHTLGDIILLHSWSGEYNRAKEYYDESEQIYKRYNLVHLERDLIRLNALLRFESGDYESTIEEFLILYKIDTGNNIRSFMLTYYLIISESYLFLNSIDKANEYIKLAESIRVNTDEYLSNEFDSHKAILKKITSVEPAMEKLFIANHKNYESSNYTYNKTQVEFHLADYYYKKGNFDTCIQFLKTCLETSYQKSYHSYLTQHYRSYRYLFDLARANNIETGYLKFLHEKVREKLEILWHSEACKERSKREIIEINDVSLKTFGGTEILVRGKAVKEDLWIRKKSKLLLIYLLVNQGLRIQKDKVLGIFFSELSAESADNIFHQAITNIRNVLKPGLPSISSGEPKTKKTVKKGELKTEITPSLIVYEDKILHMAPGFDYKVDVIEFNKLAARVSSPETEETEKEILAKKAIGVYEGEFLPGYYDEWIEELRSILQHKYTETAEILLAILKKKNKYEELISYSEKLLLTDKLHEEAFYYIIYAYNAIGNETMAKRKFSQLLKNYEEEYGEKPPKELLGKIQAILE